MNSEKVKEIKKVLEYGIENGKALGFDTKMLGIKAVDILTLINELESDNERLSKELDSEWKDRRKAEEDLHKAQWKYKIGLAQSRKRNKELKDRIAELEKENGELLKENEGYHGSYRCAIDKIGELSAERYIKVEQFAEKVAKRLININGIKQILDETLKEFID